MKKLIAVLFVMFTFLLVGCKDDSAPVDTPFEIVSPTYGYVNNDNTTVLVIEATDVITKYYVGTVENPSENDWTTPTSAGTKYQRNISSYNSGDVLYIYLINEDGEQLSTTLTIDNVAPVIYDYNLKSVHPDSITNWEPEKLSYTDLDNGVVEELTYFDSDCSSNTNVSDLDSARTYLAQSDLNEVCVNYVLTDTAGNSSTYDVVYRNTEENITPPKIFIEGEDVSIVYYNNTSKTSVSITTNEIIRGYVLLDSEDEIDLTDLDAQYSSADEVTTVSGIDLSTYTNGDILHLYVVDFNNLVSLPITIVIDNVNPEVSNVTSNEYINNDVTLTIVEEYIDTVTYTIDGDETVYNYTTNQSLSADGVYTFTLTDLAGNVSTLVFTIDQTAPTFEGTYEIEDDVYGTFIYVEDETYYNTTVTVGITEINFDVAKYRLDNGSWTDFANGQPFDSEGKYDIIVTDKAGNTTEITFYIDKTAPIYQGANSGQHNDGDSVVMIFDEDSKVFIEYSTDLGNTWTTISDYSNDYVEHTFSGEGRYDIRIVDEAGNVTEDWFIIDTTSPTYNLTDGAHYNDNSVIVDYFDMYIDKATIQYKVLPTDEFGTAVALVDGESFTAEGYYLVYLEDQATNNVSFEFVIDRTAPAITATYTDGILDYNDHINLSVNVVFTDQNDVTAQYRLDASGNYTDFDTDYDFTADGDYIIIATDKAGNYTVFEYVIDTIKPTFNTLIDGTYYQNNQNIGYNDRYVDTVTAVLNNSGYTDQVISNGHRLSSENTHTITLTDKAGNVNEITVYLDKNNPTITSDQDYFTSDNTTLTITDTFFDYAEYSTDNSNWSSLSLDGDSKATLKDQNTYYIRAYDKSGRVSYYSFVKDNTNPTILGFTDGKYYNEYVTVSYDDNYSSYGSIDYNNSYVQIYYQNGNYTNEYPTKYSFNSGTTFYASGIYTIYVQDYAGNYYSESFVIDMNTPQVSGFVDNGIYNEEITVNFSDINFSSAKYYIDANGGSYDGTSNYMDSYQDFTTGLTFQADSDKGDKYDVYILVTDKAGNEAEMKFTIDTTIPVLTFTNAEDTELEDGIQTSSSVIVSYSDDGTPTGNYYLNGSSSAISFDSDTEFSEEGYYLIEVYDDGQNYIYKSFVIDRTAPTPVGFTNGDYYTTTNGITVSITDAVCASQTCESIDFTRSTIELGQTGQALIGESGIKVTQEGTYTVTLYDKAGNYATYTFVIDSTAPTYLGVENNGYYNDATVTVTLTDNLEDNINFENSYYTLNSGNQEALTTPHNFTAVGTYYLYIVDKAGNPTTVTFTIDRTAPTFNITDGAYLNESTVILQLSDNTSAFDFEKSYYTVNNGTTYINSSNVSLTEDGEYYVYLVDAAGNINTLEFTKDTVKPVITSSDVESGGIISGSVTINYSDALSGVKSAEYSIENGTTGTISNGTHTFYDNGEYTITVTDNANNVHTYTFTIDVTPPNLTATVNGTTLGTYEYTNQNVTVTYSDAETSVVTALHYLNGSLVGSFSSNSTYTAVGTHLFRVIDAAGNVTEITFNIDKTALTIAGAKDGSYYSTDVTISLTDTGSYAVSGVNYSASTYKFTDTDNNVSNGTMTANHEFSQSGTYVITAVDYAGNESTLTFHIDKEGPEISVRQMIGSGAGYLEDEGTATQYVRVYFEDANDVTATYSIDGLYAKKVTSGSRINDKGLIVITAVDSLGNTSTFTFTRT